MESLYGDEPPLQKGEVVSFSGGQTGLVTRAYPMEDKFAVKALGAAIEIRGPDNAFFYFKREDLKRAVTPSAPLVRAPQLNSDVHLAAQAVADATGHIVESEEEEFSDSRLRGQIKWFLKDKGFGKLTPNAIKGQLEGEDVFVHKNQCEGGADGPHARGLSEGAQISYELTTGSDGKPCACNLRVDGVTKALADLEAAPALSGHKVDLIRSLVGTGLHVGNFQAKGEHKPTMEDRMVARTGIPVESLGVSCKKCVCAFFGVFDGHSGASCSDFVSTNLDRNLFECLRHQMARDVTSEMAVKTALLGAYRMTEHNFFQYLNRLEGGAAYAWASAGSTSSTVLFYGPDEEQRLRLAIANAGDSRAVLGKKDCRAYRLSEDHTPDVPSERKRIEAAGAAVTQSTAGIWRIVLRGSNIAGLSVSRGFGDLDYKNPSAVVTAVPDLFFRTLDLREDSFVIIASDGVWGPMSDADAVRIVATGLRDAAAAGDPDPAKVAAQRLVELAHVKEGHDDKTVVVIWFGDMPDLPMAQPAPVISRSAAAIRKAHHSPGGKLLGDDIFQSSQPAAQPQAQVNPPSEMAQLDDLFASYEMDLHK